MNDADTKALLVSLSVRLAAKRPPSRKLQAHPVNQMSAEQIEEARDLAREQRLQEDVAALRERAPFAASQRQVKALMGWGSRRSLDALRRYREECN